MTKEKMHKLAYLKWEWIVDNWNYNLDFDTNIRLLENQIPELKTLENSCSYCSKYFKFHKNGDFQCYNCPLYIIKQCCSDPNSFYFKWESISEDAAESNEAKAEGVFYTDMLRETIKCLAELDGVKV